MKISMLIKHVENSHSLAGAKKMLLKYSMLKCLVAQRARPFNVCKVCAGCIDCLQKQFEICETVYVASSEAWVWIVLDVEVTLQFLCWNELCKKISAGLSLCILMARKFFSATSCCLNRCFSSTCFAFFPVPILVAMLVPRKEWRSTSVGNCCSSKCDVESCCWLPCFYVSCPTAVNATVEVVCCLRQLDCWSYNLLVVCSSLDVAWEV